MRYLIINGSPHKGNTWKIVGEVKDFINSSDKESKFKEVHLIKEDIPFCDGCSKCFRNGGDMCTHKDKIKKILTMIDDADGVIIASTAFTSKETALLRNFFNHLEYLVHRPHFFNKKAIVVTSTSGIGAKAVAKEISNFLRLIGFNKCYEIAIKTYSWNAFEMNNRVKIKCQKIAKKFNDDIKTNKKYSPTLKVIFWYNLFRGTSRYVGANSKYPTKDGEYWISEKRLKKSYDDEIIVPIYKKIFGQSIFTVGKISGRFLEVTYRNGT